jgi:hypothetical protein
MFAKLSGSTLFNVPDNVAFTAVKSADNVRFATEGESDQVEVEPEAHANT